MTVLFYQAGNHRVTGAVRLGECGKSFPRTIQCRAMFKNMGNIFTCFTVRGNLTISRAARPVTTQGLRAIAAWQETCLYGGHHYFCCGWSCSGPQWVHSPLKNQNPSYGSKVTAISNKKKRARSYKFQKNCPHRKMRTSRGDKFRMKKKLPLPHYENISWSHRDKFKTKKDCPHPTTRNYSVSWWHVTTRQNNFLFVNGAGWLK